MESIIPLFKHDFNDFTIINENKSTFIDELLKTMEYYYTPNCLFFLKDNEVKYYCKLKANDKELKEINGITTVVKNSYINFYDLEKKEKYVFYGYNFFDEHDDFFISFVPNFLKSDEGKEYYKHYLYVSNSKDYFTIQFFWETFTFKKSNPRCIFHDNGFNNFLIDYVNKIAFTKDDCFNDCDYPKIQLQTAKVLMLADRPYIFL